MVRFLKTQVEEFSSDGELDGVMAMENVTSFLYIPASVLISLDILGKYEIIPYVGTYRWRLLLPACVYLALANVRDLHICARNYLISNDESVMHKTLVGQMQVTSSLLMSLGSLSLLNACVIGLLSSGDKSSNMVGSVQYVASFGFFVAGCAANTVPLHPELAGYDASRAMLTFQHIIVCVLLCAEGMLMLPGLIEHDSIDLRDLLVRMFAISASAILMFSSVVNYFHTLGLLQTMRVLARASEEDMDTRKQVSIAEPVRKAGFFDNMLGLFSSRSREIESFTSHAKYRRNEIEPPYECEPFLVSDASSAEMKWDEMAERRSVRDAEEGRYRSDSDERKRRSSGHRKKRKERKR